MRKTFLFGLLVFFLMFPVVESASVNVRVDESLNGNMFVFHKTENITKMTIEFQNTGSAWANVRARMDIFKDGNIIFTGWSGESVVVPGERKAFDIFWFEPNLTGIFDVRLRTYYSFEIIEENTELEVDFPESQDDLFEIHGYRLFSDRILLFVSSNKKTDAVIVFKNYPNGWLIEQKKVEFNKGILRVVEIPIKTTGIMGQKITVGISSIDGHYYSERELILKQDFKTYFLDLIFSPFRIIFSLL